MVVMVPIWSSASSIQVSLNAKTRSDQRVRGCYLDSRKEDSSVGDPVCHILTRIHR